MKLEQLRGKHDGSRIDLVGNADNIIPWELRNPSFASNLINRCFGYLDWRPYYYVCTDKFVLDNYEADVCESIAAAKYAFLPHDVMERYDGESVVPIIVKQEPFVDELTEGIYGHGTTLMFALKLSWWMGYKDIVFRNCDLYFGDSLHFYGDDSMAKLSREEMGRRRAKHILAHAKMIEFCNEKGMTVSYA